MATVTVHRLSGRDEKTLTATCSVCGPVGIAKAGNGFQCEIKKRAGQRAWRQQNPERSTADRRRRSGHELTSHDYLKLTAWCVQCEDHVDLVAWGRGYACGVRARELRTVQQEAPARPCRDCLVLDGDKVYPVDGSCPRCTDPARYDTGLALKYAEARASDLDGLEAGFMVVDITGDPCEMADDYESAVPGWKTIGSSRPWRVA